MFNLNKVSEKFRKDFYPYRSMHMGVYGTGNNARAILQDCDDFDISCVIVRDGAGGHFCGKPVKSIEEAILDGIEMVVLAAEADIELLIYDRIREVCQKNSIKVFGLHIGDIAAFREKASLICVNAENSVGKEDIMRMIDEHDAVCFNIFDTALMRMTLDSRDVFAVVQKKAEIDNIHIGAFPYIRIHAELTNPEPFPTIHDIYSYMAKTNGLDGAVADKLKEIEISVEKKVIRARKEVYELYLYAKQQKKQVFLVSDTYLTQDILAEYLHDVGIDDYDGVFLSCELKTTKNDDLFRAIIDKHSSLNYLHIGDDKKADGLSAMMNGMDAVIIPSTYEKLMKSELMGLCTTLNNVNEKSMLGLCVQKVFGESPRQELKVDDATEYGFLFLGPVVTAFVIWLIEEIQHNRISKVLFAARDGYLFLRLYNRAIELLGINDMPEGIYFYTSRRACLRAYCRNDDALDEVLKQYNFTLDDISRNYSESENYHQMSMVDVFDCAQNEFIGYQKYIDSLGIRKDDRIAFVDLVSGGTCQYYLEQMYLSDMIGFYLSRGMSWVKKTPRICSLIEEIPGNNTNYFSKIEQVKLLEAVMTSPEPSLAGFTKDGQKVFLTNEATEEYKEFVAAVQKGITEYLEEYLRYLYVPGVKISTVIVKELMDSRNIIKIDDCILKNIHIEDELMGTKF
jgi:FMN phosphatase YigB (HAD superfamily)